MLCLSFMTVPPPESNPVMPEGFRACPNCGKAVDARKRVCHHCGALIPPEAPPVTASASVTPPRPSAWNIIGRVLAVIGMIVCSTIVVLDLLFLGIYCTCSQRDITWNAAGRGPDPQTVAIMIAIAVGGGLGAVGLFVLAILPERRKRNKL